MKRYIISLIVVMPLLATVLCGCSNESSEGGRIDPDYTTLVLKMNVLMNDSPQTRALTSQQEAYISEIDVLVFSVTGKVETFLYHVTPEPGWDNTNQTFSVKIRNSEHINDYKRIVLIANLNSRIEELKSSFTGLSKAEVLEMITFDATTAWGNGANSAFKPIPMWGETAKPVIISPADSPLDAVSMVRALARIETGINLVDQGNNTYAAMGLATNGGPEPFMITGIKVYNSNDKGLAAPKASVFSNNAVSAPSVPQNASTNGPLEYSYSDASGVLSSTRDIYIPEADNHNVAEGEEMFLLIKGYYTAPGESNQNTSQETWYKVDFHDREAAGAIHEKRIDILRNHYYMVNITSVDGPGYGTEEEAANSYGTLLGIEISVWDEADINAVSILADNRLIVEPKNMELGKTGRSDNEVSVTSTQAWQAWTSTSANEITGTVDWITLTMDSASAGISNIEFTNTDNDGTERYAYIHVKSGRLTNTVKVTQLDRELITMQVTPADELVFYGKSWMIKEKPITITWTPASLEVQVEYITVGNGGVPLDTRFDSTLYNGSDTFYIQPDPWTNYNRDEDLFKVKESKFRFTATHPNGATLIKEVSVKQFMPDAIITDVLDIGYSMLEQNETVTVISNVPWNARIQNGGASSAPAVGSLVAASGSGTMAGEPLTMKMYKGSTDIYKGVSEIMVYSEDGLFEPVTASISGRYGFIYWSDEANGYMVVTPYDNNYMGRADARETCDDLGHKWELPSSRELRALRRALGGPDATFDGQIMQDKYNFVYGVFYWSSTTATLVWENVVIDMTYIGEGSKPWNEQLPSRCVKGYHSF